DHQSGTDRIAEVAKDIDCDLVINVQGDEPLIPPELIDKIIEHFERDNKLLCATAACVFNDEKDVNSPDMVKVVVDKNWNALYFSRAAIPYPAELDKGKLKQINSDWKGRLRHIGIYAFRKETLMKFVELEPSPLEKLEHLEQLRLLENGIKIKVILTDYHPIAVDTPEDIKLVLKALTNESK
ncbi:MAG: 3-deoxy-manno-octulosonate cytidylyltransferase, partial [candidate division Zixibacteria bacterium]|nr:3-deoxy-manno-octulosonate cytidylyltransferase [candidate division Zixibacteria bacterium]